MKKLSSFMKPYKIEAVLGPLFKLFEASLELTVPLVIALIIDNGINANDGLGDVPYIVRMGLLLVLFAFVGLAFSVIAQYFAAKASAISAVRSFEPSFTIKISTSSPPTKSDSTHFYI